VWTADGLQYQVNAGGPVPEGLGDYYPGNFTFPYQVNGGVPSSDPSQVGSAAWWFAQGTTNPGPTNPYYDPLLAECLNVTCTFPIFDVIGYSQLDEAIDAFIAQVEQLSEPSGCSSTSCAALQPWLQEVGFDCYGSCINHAPSYQDVWFDGWVADYPDPSDVLGGYAGPTSTYVALDSVATVLNQSQFENAGCGHSSDTLANLSYWADSGPVPQACQFVAYSVAEFWQTSAFGLPLGAARTSEYQLVDEVLSNLDLYVWMGQSVVTTFAAPWIALGSINTNPMIGGGGYDKLFYQLHYAARLTVRETGLPLHSTWGVDLGGYDHNTSSSTVTFGASAGLSQSNDWSAITPIGYALTHAVPLGVTSPVDVPTTGETVTLAFAKLSAVTISESGLPVGTNWSVTVTPPLAWDFSLPQRASEVVTPSGPNEVTFTGLVAGTWDYKVSSNPASALDGFKTVPLTVLSGARGAPLVVPYTGASVTKALVFSLATAEVTFTERGIPAVTHPSWSVTVSGTEANGQAYGPVTVTKTAPAAATFALPDGSYTYTFTGPTIGANAYTATGGSITLNGLHPWTPPTPADSSPHYPVHATFTDPPAGPAQPFLPSIPGARERD
jgi:hypothetical protein